MTTSAPNEHQNGLVPPSARDPLVIAVDPDPGHRATLVADLEAALDGQARVTAAGDGSAADTLLRAAADGGETIALVVVARTRPRRAAPRGRGRHRAGEPAGADAGAGLGRTHHPATRFLRRRDRRRRARRAAAAVNAASEGPSTLLVEREAPGGQAGSSSRIENYVGFPAGISGRISVLTREQIVALDGDDQLQIARVRNLDTDEEQDLAAAAVFAFIGARPASAWLDGVLARDERGFILTDNDLTDAPEALRWASLVVGRRR